MKNRIILSILATLLCLQAVYAQLGIGLTASNDVYHYYQNPSDDTGMSTSAGSALFNVGLGPKIWVGTQNFSLSVEAQATVGLLGLSVRDYKGLGTTSFPIMAKLNFGGLTCFNKEGTLGWSIGAGMQYNRTELFYVKDDFSAAGGERDFYRVFVGQLGYGFGMSGFTAHGFIRYGYDPETNAKAFNFGIQYDFNIPKMLKITDPASEL